MATTPKPPQHSTSKDDPRHSDVQTPKPPERHPAEPPPARPGVAQRDQQPHPDDPNAKPPPEEKPVPKEEALQLFRAGHRLRIKGNPPEKWFAAFRLHNQLVICYPVDEEVEKSLEGQELVLADEPTAP
jgi:hypothetical protein